MGTPEANRILLESKLDDITVNMHRFLSERKHTYNGTALGVVSIGWGIYPSGEGAYTGHFGMKLKKGTTLIMQVRDKLEYDDVVFMSGWPSGRGHKINYFKTPKGFGNALYDSSEAYKEIDSFEQAPITDKELGYLLKCIGDFKRGEFMTMRHYATQHEESYPDFFEEEAYKETMEECIAKKPDPLPVLRIEQFVYTVAEHPGEGTHVILHPSGFSGKDLELDVDPRYKDSGTVEKGNKIFIRKAIPGNLDPADESSWSIIGMTYFNQDIFNIKRPSLGEILKE